MLWTTPTGLKPSELLPPEPDDADDFCPEPPEPSEPFVPFVPLDWDEAEPDDRTGGAPPLNALATAERIDPARLGWGGGMEELVAAVPPAPAPAPALPDVAPPAPAPLDPPAALPAPAAAPAPADTAAPARTAAARTMSYAVEPTSPDTIFLAMNGISRSASA